MSPTSEEKTLSKIYQRIQPTNNNKKTTIEQEIMSKEFSYSYNHKHTLLTYTVICF